MESNSLPSSLTLVNERVPDTFEFYCNAPPYWVVKEIGSVVPCTRATMLICKRLIQEEEYSLS